MSTAENKFPFEPWKPNIPSFEGEQSPYDSAIGAEDDKITWPPVIARIRDLDQPAAAAMPSPVVSTNTQTVSNSLREKIVQRRRNRQIYSRIIALIGIIIVLVGVLPFLRMKEKSNLDSATTALQPTPPAATASANPAQPISTASATAPAEKITNQPVPAPTAPSLTTNVPATTGIVAAPSASITPDKKETVGNVSLPPASAIKVNPAGDIPKEQIAVQGAIQPAVNVGETPIATNPPTLLIPAEKPNLTVDRVVQGESCPWDPNAQAPAVEPRIENRPAYEADARASYRPPYDPIPDYRRGPDSEPNPATYRQNPPTYGQNPAPYGQTPPPYQNQTTYDLNSAPYGQNPSNYGQNPASYSQNQGPYIQSPGSSSQNPALYRQASATSGQNQALYGQNNGAYNQNSAPYGQNRSLYGQNPAPYGQNPQLNMRGGAIPQASPQSVPNQQASPNYPYVNPSLPSNTMPGTTTDAGRQGGAYAPAMNNNYPNAGYPGTLNPAVGNTGDYPYPVSR